MPATAIQDGRSCAGNRQWDPVQTWRATHASPQAARSPGENVTHGSDMRRGSAATHAHSRGPPSPPARLLAASQPLSSWHWLPKHPATATVTGGNSCT